MALAPDLATPGLWCDSSWDGTSPATFAVVIGVSHYPHLAGGGQQATGQKDWVRDGRALGQLYVSAMTARRVFDWLRQDYRITGAPLVRAWLLLSPSAAELAAEPGMMDGAIAATLDNCTDAIRDWAAATEAANYRITDVARMLFFFSGHGIEVSTQNQMLLPQDYLGGVLPNYNDALSTANLLNATDNLPAAFRFFFVDACRNDYQSLRQLLPTGQAILPVYPAHQNYQGAQCQALLYATSPALRAWQPTKPSDGPTIFGQALLEGLRGQPDMVLTPPGSQTEVDFLELQAFVNRRMTAIIRRYDASATQRSQPWGNYGGNRVVTEIAPTPPAPPRPAPSLPSPYDSRFDFPMEDFPWSADDLPAPVPVPMPRAEPAADDAGPGMAGAEGAPAEDPVPASRTETREISATDRRRWSTDFDAGHRVFGHEHITDLMQRSLRVAVLDRDHWLPPDVLAIRRSSRTEQSAGDEAVIRYELLLEILTPDPAGYWLQLGLGRCAGLVLPEDPTGAHRYVLEIDIDAVSREIRGLRGRTYDSLGLTPLRQAISLWKTLETEGILAALALFERRPPVLHGEPSPLAATIVATVLLRTGRVDLLRGWLRDWPGLIDEGPDGAAITAELAFRTPGEDNLAATAGSLAQLARRGVPVTAAAFELAGALFDRLGPAGAQPFAPELSRAYETARGLMAAARGWYRPGGLLTSFAGFETAELAAQISPAAVAQAALSTARDGPAPALLGQSVLVLPQAESAPRGMSAP